MCAVSYKLTQHFTWNMSLTTYQLTNWTMSEFKLTRLSNERAYNLTMFLSQLRASRCVHWRWKLLCIDNRSLRRTNDAFASFSLFHRKTLSHCWIAYWNVLHFVFIYDWQTVDRLPDYTRDDLVIIAAHFQLNAITNALHMYMWGLHVGDIELSGDCPNPWWLLQTAEGWNTYSLWR